MKHHSLRFLAIVITAMTALQGCDFNINTNSTISGSAGPAPSPTPSSTQVSASGTTIPSASQIIDSQNNVWTLMNGVVLENGADAGYSADVVLLLYYNGVIYQENDSDGWWSWTDNAWVSVSGDPRVAATPPPSTATQVFSYPDGFASAGSAVSYNGTLDGSEVLLTNGEAEHQAGGLWYATQQNITTFTTDFTFQVNNGFGMFFSIQNTNSTNDPNPYDFYGDKASADANGEGYGAYEGLASQYPLVASIGIKFDSTDFNGSGYLGATPSSTGLYMNGGPSMYDGFYPEEDIAPYGLIFSSGHVFAGHLVYDGTNLVMVLQDTTTGAQVRKIWPVNIAAMTQSNNAWVGFTGGTVTAAAMDVLSWDFYEGYNTRLAAPSFSVPGGQYAAAQTVAISGPSGAKIYYTTNGQLPTTSSSLYSGPITVSSSEYVQAIAIESGYTDSLPGSANYQISSSSDAIDLAGGFSGASGLVTANGMAQITGSALQLTDTSQYSEAGSSWYVAPVGVTAGFTTDFTLSFPGGSSVAQANGMAFVIQNYLPSSQDVGGFPAWGGNLVVSGGINALGYNQPGLGYQGILSSAAIIFDLYNGSGDLTGLYTNGAQPTGSSIDMTSSGVSLKSGHPLAVSLSYNGTTLVETVTDTVTNAKFSTSYTINIPATVGGNTAYVGFTGSTGGLKAIQQVLNWTYAN